MKRVSWKRGMRLTDDIMRASDESVAEMLSHALLLAAGGRFGLLPSSRSFNLMLNIGGNIVDVETLNCLAVTKGGQVIDAQYDKNYTNNTDTRILIPEGFNTHEFILLVNAVDGEWQERYDGFEEPVYAFSLVAPDTVIPENALPIGRIIDDHGWRMDDSDFVPPCLLVSAHWKYEDLLNRFADLLATIDTKSRASLNSAGRNAIRIFWPIIQQLRIAMSKERDLMTPMALLSNVQKCVSAFTCACDLEVGIDLPNAKIFRNYVLAPYNYKDAYQRIKVGLELCFNISQMVENLDVKAEPEEVKYEPTVTVGAPYIREDQLIQNCKSISVAIPITNPTPGAKVFYSTDGNEPARPLPASGKITLENGFNKDKIPELDQTVTIWLKAVLNGKSSETNSFFVTLHKDYKSWNGYVI